MLYRGLQAPSALDLDPLPPPDTTFTTHAAALPIDAPVEMGRTRSKKMSFPIGLGDAKAAGSSARSLTMVLGSDTWNALPSAIVRNPAATRSAAPLAIDAIPSAPKPLWSEFPMASAGRMAPVLAPTLDAFRSTPSDPPVSNARSTARAPMPISTSPIRGTSPQQAHPETLITSHAASSLIPVGEEALDIESLRRMPTPMAAPLTPPTLEAFTARSTVVEPTATLQAEVQREANQQNFLNTVFHDSTQLTCALLDSEFDAFAVATAADASSLSLTLTRQSSSTAADLPMQQQKLRATHNYAEQHTMDYNGYWSATLEEIDSTEEADDGIEHLRSLLTLVMQTVRQSDESPSSGAYSKSNRSIFEWGTRRQQNSTCNHTLFYGM